MRKLNWIGFGSMALAAVGLFALSAGGAGCSSDEDSATVSEAGAEASAADTGVATVLDSGSVRCMRCVEQATAERRIPGSPGPCETPSLSDPTKTSKELFDTAFKCVCEDACKADCSDSCGSGSALSALCTACAASLCSDLYQACLADDPDIAPTPEDSGTDAAPDSGETDSGASDATVGQ